MTRKYVCVHFQHFNQDVLSKNEDGDNLKALKLYMPASVWKHPRSRNLGSVKYLQVRKQFIRKEERSQKQNPRF